MPKNLRSATAAIEFALHARNGLEFLRRWQRQEWDMVRREWPDAPADVYHAPGLTDEQLLNKARNLAKPSGLYIVVVDGAYLLYRPGESRGVLIGKRRKINDMLALVRQTVGAA